jgi:hypothetical protein
LIITKEVESIVSDGLSAELERELRLAINPLYEDIRGTESYERKRLLGEIDKLRDAMHDALEAGEAGDWQKARQALCVAFMPDVE